MRRFLVSVSALIAALLCTDVAYAQAEHTSPLRSPSAPEETMTMTGDEAFGVALRVLTEAGAYEEALGLLDTRPDLAQRPDVIRLRAQFLAATGQTAAAYALLERHLTNASDDALARFQIAELHYIQSRDQPAGFSYRLAMAGDLDDLRRDIAAARLEAIAQRRNWRFQFGASITPDSNLNAATDAARVDLFGLPFELDDAARRKSGVALSGFASLERRFRLAEGLRLRAGLAGSINDAPGAEFDEQFLSARFGPEWRLGADGAVTLLAERTGRWFGGALFETSTGLRLEAERSFDGRTHYTAAIGASDVDAELNDIRDGARYGLDLARTHFLGPSALWRVNVSLARRDAVAASESFDQIYLSVGRLVHAPFGTLAYVESFASARYFDGRAAAFRTVREDFEYGASVRLSKRDWMVFGAFPFVSLSASRANSTLSLNEFSRERVAFGFTRTF